MTDAERQRRRRAKLRPFDAYKEARDLKIKMGDRKLRDEEYRALIGAMVAELGNSGFVIKASQERRGSTVTVTVTEPEYEDEDNDEPGDAHNSTWGAFLLRTELCLEKASDCRYLLENLPPYFRRKKRSDMARAAHAVATAWSALALEMEQSLMTRSEKAAAERDKRNATLSNRH